MKCSRAATPHESSELTLVLVERDDPRTSNAHKHTLTPADSCMMMMIRAREEKSSAWRFVKIKTQKTHKLFFVCQTLGAVSARKLDFNCLKDEFKLKGCSCVFVVVPPSERSVLSSRSFTLVWILWVCQLFSVVSFLVHKESSKLTASEPRCCEHSVGWGHTDWACGVKRLAKRVVIWLLVFLCRTASSLQASGDLGWGVLTQTLRVLSIGVESIQPRRYFSFTALLIRKKLLPLTADRLQRVTASSFTWRYLMAYIKQNSTVTSLRPAAQRSEVTGSSFREVKNLQVTDDDDSDAAVNVNNSPIKHSALWHQSSFY